MHSTFIHEAIRDEAGHIQDFKVLLVNEWARRDVINRLGVDPVGKTLLSVNPDSRTMGQFNLFCQVIESGEPVQVEQFYENAQASWYNTSITKLNDGVVVTASDITAQKQQALQTERQRALLDGILNASQDAIYVLEAVRDEQRMVVDFRYTHANPMVIQLLGYPRDALFDVSYLSLFPEAKTSGRFDLYCQVVETGETIQREVFYTKNGFSNWYDITAVRLGDGVVLSVKDISDRKRYEQQIEHQAEQNRRHADYLNGVLQESSNGILVQTAIRDTDGKIVDFQIVIANEQGARITNKTVEELVGKEFLSLFPGTIETGLFAMYVHTVETEEPQTTELYYDHDGIRLWLNIATKKLDDGLVITYSDISERKRLQQALEASIDETKQQAELTRSMLNGAINGVLLLEPLRDQVTGLVTDFRIRGGNPAVYVLTGIDPDSAVGRTMSDVYPGYKENGFFDLYCCAMSTGEPQRIENRYQDDNLEGWFEVSAMRQRFADVGDGIVLTFSNTTEMRKAQEAIERAAVENKRQAELLNSVLDSSNSGIIAFEAIRDDQGKIIDFRFITVNEACERILNLPLETMRGNKLLTLFPGNVDAGTFDLYVHTTETGEPGRTETYYKYDGLDFWLDISAQKLGDGFVVTFSDISIVKRSAQFVERSAAELQTVIDTSQTGIFLFSPIRDHTGDVVDFRFRLANRMLAAYVGQTPEAVIGELGSRWFPDYKTNGLFEAYRKTYLTGEAMRFDIHYDGSGIDVWLDIMTTKMGDEVLVTFGDYTPLKKLQQKLESSIIDLQRSNANLEQFAYVASHDLQEPLRKIQAFGDIIETQYSAVIGEQGTDMIRRMQQAAARMQLLIKDVLAYSRIATIRDAVKSVDLSQLVAEVVDDLETAVSKQGAIMSIEPLPTVLGDAGQLRQLFQNLLSNALKFSKPRYMGEDVNVPEWNPIIRVMATVAKGRDAYLSVQPGDADRLFHLIEITDNGIGFEPHQAERIFQVFQRLHNRSSYQGTGIGLAVVKKVVENHNGYIYAIGRPGEGATFQILLPA
ncbi:PAS domain-containing sensor histidine kinase [Spirosoma utsteinense]|uniref:histidine kinase n=1 Tax=Spirosoma utsteinense TaxID=2585773 RepID=A0ABR6W1L1_9BACT|nr:PAS domain-containing protein [Spirosoma utsteinense]MBC3790001.1 PAS domain S-box-containing protein [Spirosoma utsteinense]